MAARTSKTTTADPEYVDLDGDGDVDAIVTSKRTVTKTIVEEQEVVLLPEEEPDPVVIPTPRAVGDPGECGENACYHRDPVTFTQSNAGRAFTFTPAWKGNIAWDFGDGSPVVVGRGPVTHTYAPGVPAGAKTVKASPIASACLKVGTAVATVV